MKTAVRLDDITPDMDYEKFYKMKQILDTYQIKPLIGVVPFNEDKNLQRSSLREDFPQILQGLVKEGYMVALHGYRHQYTSKKGGLFPLNHFSEYAGVPLKKQESMIAEGKEQLQKWGVPADIFMAPGHTFDDNTLKALKKNGFRYITDGFGKSPYERKGLVFLPIAIKQSDCYQQKEGYTTLVFHTNTMEPDDFIKYQKLFEDHKDSFVSYTDYMKVTPHKRTLPGHVWEYSLAALKHFLVRIRA